MQARLFMSSHIDKRIRLVGLLIVWVCLWVLPWQPLLKPLPAISVLIALAMYIVPGALLQQLAYPTRTLYVLRAITVGFAVSIALTSVLGLIAIVFHLSSGFVLSSLFWLSAVMLVLLFLRGLQTPAADAQRSWVNVLLTVLALVIVVLSAALTYANSSYENRMSDDETYNAYIQAYAYDTRLGFQEVFYGTDELSSARFWFAMWPMSQAIILRLSDVHLLEMIPLLKAYFMALSLLCLYELARVFKLPVPIALLAIIGQIALYYSQWEPERYAMASINQDKQVVVTIIGPILFRLLVEIFEDRRCWKIFAAACLGAVLTHTTMFALVAAVCVLYCFGEMLFFRRFRTAFQAIAVLVFCLILLLPTRFIEERYAFGLPDATSTTDAIFDQHDVRNGRLERLNIIENTPFYGLQPRTLRGTPYMIVFVSSAIALLFVRRSPAARFLVAFALLVLIIIFPYTGWLVGLGITPYHLWRIQWHIPVGIGSAFFIYAVFTLMSKLTGTGTRARRLYEVAFAVLGVASFIVVIIFWAQDDAVKSQYAVISEGHGPDLGYSTYVQLGALLDRELTEPSLVIAEDGRLSSMLPGLSHNAKTLVFRGPIIAAMQTNIQTEELRNRLRFFNRFFDSSEPSEERIHILDTYGIQLIIEEGHEEEIARLVEAYPERIVQIAQIGDYAVYRYQGDE